LQAKIAAFCSKHWEKRRTWHVARGIKVFLIEKRIYLFFLRNEWVVYLETRSALPLCLQRIFLIQSNFVHALGYAAFLRSVGAQALRGGLAKNYSN
jgi:hypothetical protein